MPYKIMMSIVATVPLIFLLAFAAIPEFFVLKSYPSAEGLALEIGITLESQQKQAKILEVLLLLQTSLFYMAYKLLNN